MPASVTRSIVPAAAARGLVALVTAVFATVPAPAPAEGLRAGIAVRSVTPDPLLPVSGGLGPSNPARKKLGDLNVRALVFENDGAHLAFVSADFLGFPGVLGDRVRKNVPGIPGDHILIGATHTHSAPDVYGFPDGNGGTAADLGYIARVCEAMAAAVNEGLQNLRPAVLKTATGEARGKIAYNYYAPELYDPRCHVMQVLGVHEGRVGEPIATLVNYAIHPEVLGADQGVLSPDLVGPLYARIAEMGGGTGIFFNGAQGGMVTADVRGEDGEDVQTWDEGIRIGHLLADEALRIVAGAAPQSDPPLQVHARRVTFPVESEPLLAVLRGSPLRYGASDDGTITTTVNLVRLGDAQVLTVPGEALPNIGYYLKRKMRGRHNLLFGLTNDAFGYILTKEDWGSFQRYDYVSRVCLGEMTGEIFTGRALQFIREVGWE